MKLEEIKQTIKTKMKPHLVVKSILLSILFLAIYYAPYLHKNYTSLKEWGVYKEHYKKHKKIKQKYDLINTQLLDELKNNKITIPNFIEQTKTNTINKDIALKAYYKTKNIIKKQYAFMGYNSYRSFLIDIGLKLFAFFASVLLLVFLLNPNHVKTFKTYYLFAITCLIYVSLFWLLHTILTKTDFPNITYNYAIISISVIATILIVVFFKTSIKLESKLKAGIKILTRYISIDLYNKVSDNNKKETLISNLKMYEKLEETIK